MGDLLDFFEVGLASSSSLLSTVARRALILDRGVSNGAGDPPRDEWGDDGAEEAIE